MVYAPLVSKRCQSYSIAPLMIKLCDNDKSQKGINTLRLHFDILKNFDNVKILSDDITSPSLHDKRIFLGSNKSYILYSITVPVVKLNLKVVCFITFMLLFFEEDGNDFLAT